MQKLTDDQLQKALSTLPGWTLKDGELVQERTFKDFVAAMAFVNDVAQLAEAASHHPDIDIRYNRVRLALVTHDAGGITQNDATLAQKINNLRA
ncbi:MAG TPA: 4a-hydroxytetrahydrobiopterin dehydratase [Acidobacteriaceae bacterium]|nr:4a-hydroxytetrahydrobiopterin dehydratase [Acidobacteriaceae bacterium]